MAPSLARVSVVVTYATGKSEGIVCQSVSLRDDELVLVLPDGTQRVIPLASVRSWRYSS